MILRRGSRLCAAVAVAALAAGVLAPGTAVAGAGAPRARAVPAIPFDLNGDGYAELAVGSPGESLGGARGTGVLTILDGSSSGVRTAGARFISQDTPGIAGTNESDDAFGSAMSSGDFNRDGYADLAVGAVYEKRGAYPRSQGSVTVLYGSPHGVKGRDDQLFLPQQLRVEDVWGAVLDSGDLNGDGYADLVIASGPPRTHFHPHGGLTILYGSANGLGMRGAVHLTDPTTTSPGSGPRDRFARSVAVGDLTGDGIADLAVDTVHGADEAGIYLYRGRSTRLSTTPDTVLAEGGPELATPDTTFVDLGATLTIGDFDGDGHGDLAAGDGRGEPPGSAGCTKTANCPGLVLVLPGAVTGVDTSRKQVWSAESPGIPGAVKELVFGGALASGDLDGDGHADLAIATSFAEAAGPVAYADGAVRVLYGSGAGLTAARTQSWRQATPGVAGHSEPDDAFGAGLRITALRGPGRQDLAVSVPGETVGHAQDAGATNVLYGESGTGLVTAGNQQWSEASPGVPGAPETYDAFGLLGGS
ncbi:MAG: FG-GAP-like repeat-containing protein [Nocardioidaceae bacterium]